MVRGMILYYLNIKPTHGYEIQQFIQLSGMDQWTKIQSGSIYYALSKLEKEGNITVLREEQTGIRLRKIYGITDKGKQTLKKEMLTELSSPIFSSDASKFVTSPILSTLSTEEIEETIRKHISELKEKKKYWEVWAKRKTTNKEDTLIKLSFEMTISSIHYQILWHEELLNNVDYYKKEANEMSLFIKNFNSEISKE